MNLQLAIIDLLRGTPKPVLRLLSGKPSRIDGRTLDLNMHMMAKLAARGASSTRAPMTVNALRQAASAYNSLNLPIADGVTTLDTALSAKRQYVERTHLPSSGRLGRAPRCALFPPRRTRDHGSSYR
jgi:hypothetical protein